MFAKNFREMLILPAWEVGVVEVDGAQFPRLSLGLADGKQLHIMLSVDSAQQLAAALDKHANDVADRRAGQFVVGDAVSKRPAE